ncbi:Ribosomal protein L25/L23 [Penicillium griseofulvum]|uniref:Large ribosomal subunit protein uL23m n=1 Tax=Penicillium patulum TaxID=5078 RepID=A0A135LEW8_PENPA|nr:Ribosomal protein L25/L23 [Penicillium griseofulvum]KXG47440.1 Ribosomal protein L25/L23 [Penicillium griseofulvum]
MVRLSSVQAKALRRLQNQAAVQAPPKPKWPSNVGKPVYLIPAVLIGSIGHSPRNKKEPELIPRLIRPQFRVALVRTPNLTPRYAQFRVPLNFNKFDLRSYLWHLYGVASLGIRSYVQAQPITRVSRDGKGFGPWRRPKSQKRMTVELKEPFVYPEAPKDLTPWEHESWAKAEQFQIDLQEKENPKPNKGEKPDQELRNAYKEQAQALLEKKETWRPTWKALGLEPRKVTKNGGFIASSTLPAWYTKGRKHGAR